MAAPEILGGYIGALVMSICVLEAVQREAGEHADAARFAEWFDNWGPRQHVPSLVPFLWIRALMLRILLLRWTRI